METVRLCPTAPAVEQVRKQHAGALEEGTCSLNKEATRQVGRYKARFQRKVQLSRQVARHSQTGYSLPKKDQVRTVVSQREKQRQNAQW